MPAVLLASGKANIFMDGNPIVYGGAIDRIENDPKDGQVVGVFDHNQRPIGWGTFNSSSMFRVRMMELAKETESPILIKRVVKKRIEEAKMLRDKVLDLKNGKTNAYRLVNSEGDRLSGIIIDKYGNDNHFVVSSSAGWVEAQRGDIIEALREVMLKENENMTVVWRRDVDMYALEGVGVTEKVSVYDKNGDDASASLPSEIEITENGVKYLVNLTEGHKTGFYVDQRDNRAFIGELSKTSNDNSDFSVLDCCTYTGGFAINAAVAGCKNVSRRLLQNSPLHRRKERRTEQRPGSNQLCSLRRLRLPRRLHRQQPPIRRSRARSSQVRAYGQIFIQIALKIHRIKRSRHAMRQTRRYFNILQLLRSSHAAKTVTIHRL